jgi:uncharacterized secreted protein with C-terminal beta-propeller domain
MINPASEASSTDASFVAPARAPYIYSSDTTVYKFELNAGKATYRSKADVPGEILNQFSMDESGGYFRIATNIGGTSDASSNNMYALDGDMKIVGKIEGIAPGERIYSVRFMGDRAYMVTFRSVDPLFAVDLSDPRDPKILGQLKIPGYSDYLHPYDDNLLIGFGKDAIADGNTAFYQGMKISMFDVSNVGDPIELFSRIIGDRGTDSPVLRDHKALLFSKARGLLADPVSVAKISPNDKADDITTYGRLSFQGAYVFDVNLTDGFVKRGEITHAGEIPQTDEYWFRGDADKEIDRIIYIGDTLYTTSASLVKATSLDGMTDVAEARLD